MPYVNIKVTKEGVTAKQKEQLIEGRPDCFRKFWVRTLRPLL
jgi:4-oxalocrotonate tautomerase family enzyme